MRALFFRNTIRFSWVRSSLLDFQANRTRTGPTSTQPGMKQLRRDVSVSHNQQSEFGRVESTKRHVELNKMIVNHGRSNDWEAIMRIFQAEQRDFGLVNLATSVSQLARIQSLKKEYPTLHILFENIADHIDASVIDTRSYSNIVHSIAKMQVQTNSTLRILNHMARSVFSKEFIDSGQAQDVSVVAWSLARLRRPDLMNVFMEQMNQQNVANLFNGKVQAVANTALACAKLAQSSPALFDAINQRSDWLVTNGDTQDIANTAWACAKLGHSSPQLFASIEQHGEWLVSNSHTQAVANTAWACAKLGHSSPALFAIIDNHSHWLVDNGATQSVANTVWACAKLGHSTPALFAAIERRSEWIVNIGVAQEIANTAWACAKLGHTSPTLFDAIDKRGDWLVNNGSTQAVANTAWACATLGHSSPTLFAALEKRTDWLVTNGISQEIENTAWACKQLGHSSPNLFAAVAKHTEQEQ